MRVERTITIRASQERVWEHLADVARMPRYMTAITRLEHAGGPRVGLGARYNIRWQVGSAHPGGLVEVVEFDPGWEVAWSAVTGIEHRGRWRLRPGRGGTTRVTFRLIYTTPGLPWGPAVDAVSAPIVGGIVRRSLDELRRQVEAQAPAPPAAGPFSVALHALEGAAVLGRAGLLKPPGPLQAAGLLGRLATWGVNPAAAYGYAALLSADRAAIVDDAGSLTFAEVDRRTNALARALAREGVDERSTVGVLARNHRGFVEATIAAWKLGSRVTFLNTSFAGPQLRDVVRREDVALVLHDAEFGEQVSMLPRRVGRVLTWEEGLVGTRRSLDDLIDAEPAGPTRPPRQAGRAVILTSGTTGAPRGAQRGATTGIGPAVALLSRLPLRVDETTLLAAPLFHAWGFGSWMLSLLLRSTVVLQRRFDPEAVLAAVEQQRPSALVAVPVMLERILELPARTRRRYDTSSLRVVAVSGSALAAGLATRFMDEFGDVLYNLYGSTEVAWAAIATPDELRGHPDTAGRPPIGTVVRVYRDDGTVAGPGETGQIHVGNELLTPGLGREMRDGLMSTGDLGRFDDDGLLFVAGRSDDMIVSGGENVYPAEVEETISRLDGVAEVAVVGAADERFGQSLRAFVVKRRGARLTEERVKEAVRTQLARYKVPRSVVFVESLPRNATGKVVRRELAGEAPARDEHVRPARVRSGSEGR